jgi:hypothetical protein
MPAKKNKAVTAVEILRYARALLAKRGGWTKGSNARDKRGLSINATDANACKFCAFGAIYRSNYDLNRETSTSPVETLLLKAFDKEGFGLAGFNDRQTTVKPVLALYDKAIAKLEANNG